MDDKRLEALLEQASDSQVPDSDSTDATDRRDLRGIRGRIRVRLLPAVLDKAFRGEL
jgi:hypothetical protein